MKNVLTIALSAAAVCAVLTATPAFAQATVTGAPAGEAPVTVEGYGNAPGQPGYGYNGAYEYGDGTTPAYVYAPGYGPGYVYGFWPFAPVGAFVGDLGAGAVGATGAMVGATTGAPTYAATPNARCHIYRDDAGRRICGP